MIDLLIYLLALAILVGLIAYVVQALGAPEPLRTWIIIVAVVIGGLIIVFLLLGLVGHGPALRL